MKSVSLGQQIAISFESGNAERYSDRPIDPEIHSTQKWLGRCLKQVSDINTDTHTFTLDGIITFPLKNTYLEFLFSQLVVDEEELT